MNENNQEQMPDNQIRNDSPYKKET
jgi:hypothetical protein